MSIWDLSRCALFSIVLVFFSEVHVHSQSSQSLEEKRKQTLKEIDETSRFLKETEKSRTESFHKLELLNAQIKQFEKLMTGIRDEITIAERTIKETSIRVTQMDNEIEKMKAEYAGMVLQTYKNRGQYNMLVYVLSSRDFNEAYRRIKYFQQYSEYRIKQVAEIKAKQDELYFLIKQLEEMKVEKETLLAEQRRESQKLEYIKVEQNREMNRLMSQERRLKNQLIIQRQRAQRLQQEIEKAIADAAKKRNVAAKNLYEVLTPDERLISDNFKGNKGRLPWPTEKGIITRFFGKNLPHPLFKDIRMDYDGVDITTVGGADIRAIFDGEVMKIGVIPGNNMFVLVQHGNYITVYSNLVDIAVKQGDKLISKQKIGKVYTEKDAKTAIVQFKIWEGLNNALDPEVWLLKN